MGTLDELIHYCRIEDPIGSLVLIGESGCGKTYLIERELREALEDTHCIVRVSLFGINSIGALHDAVLDEEPGDDADKHKGEEIKRKGGVLQAVEVDVHLLERLDADREGEPVDKYRECGLDRRPQRTDDGALVGLDQLIFR